MARAALLEFCRGVFRHSSEQDASSRVALAIEQLETRLLLTSPQIFLTPSVLSNLVQEAQANTPQWTAFKANLDAGLAVVDSGAYQGSELTAISDYALGYQVLKTIDPLTAANYADKAIGLMKSALNDYQVNGSVSEQFLVRGNGVTTSFVLPNADIIPSSLQVYLSNVTTVPIVRGAANTQDSVGNYLKFLKVSNTPDGNADYVQGVDWRHNPDLADDLIDWSLGGKEPAPGSTYYVTYTDGVSATPVNFTLSGHTITLAKAPTSAQAVYVQYIYGTHSASGSTLAYQQTSAGDGGFNSIFKDTTYTSRYLGKHVAMGLDWLDGYVGLSSSFRSQVIAMLERWFDYVLNNGYYNDSPTSNYGAGGYDSMALTALAILNRDPAGTTLMSEILAYRQTNLIPGLQGPNSEEGGFWAEGWNYGPLAAQNDLLAGLALEAAGQIPSASVERTWASQVVDSLISEQPDKNTIYDGGDWYTYPSPFPDNTLISILSSTADDSTARSYANYILQTNPGNNGNDYIDLLFRNPAATGTLWGAFPLQYYADGTGLVTARADWNYNSTWMSFQLGNLLSADHQTNAPGQLQIQRGSDDLLINANAIAGNQDIHTKSSFANLIAIDDNGAGTQNYSWNMGVWYGTPGVFITNYEATGGHVYVGGDYRAAYSLNTDPGGGGTATQLTRQVVYLRPDLIITFDRAGTVLASDPKQLQWHFLNPAKVNGNAWEEDVGSSKLFGKTFSSVPLTTTTYSVNDNGATVYRVATNNTNQAPNVQYVTALETAPSTTGAMLSSQQVVSTDRRMQGVQIGSNVVLFGTNGPIRPFSGSIDYSISSNTSITQLLTDLQPDLQYVVKANSVVLGTFTSSHQGTLSFTTPAGSGAISVMAAVSPGLATHFSISAPASATAGSPFSITVTALDSFNNSCPLYAGTAHFTSTDGAAVLPTDYTFTAGDAGVHTFTNGVTLKTAGTKSVTVTDTAASSITGSASVTVNPAAASKLIVSGYPSSTTAGVAHNFTVTAQDAFNNTATAYTGTMTFTSSDGLAALPANYTFVAGDSGVHTFSATLKTAGSQSITATDTVTSSIKGSQGGISVNPAAASKLVVAGYASPTIAGVAHNFTVTALDAFNNTATGYTGTVTFTSSDSQAALPANFTFTAGNAGVRTFSATLNTVGTQSITAKDTVTSTITGTQTGITVNQAGASHFLVNGFPSSTTAGVAHSFTVTAVDPFGNTVTGYTGTVTFTSSDGQAVLPANYAFVGGDAGVHTFSATLKTAGSQSVTATDTTTSTLKGSQTGITVNPAAAVSLVVAGFATPSTAGTSHPFTVTAKDAFGNTASGYTGTVTFTSSDPKPVVPANYTFVSADAGTHTFSATLKTAGIQTITATDTVTGTIKGTQTGITVNAAAASHFILSSFPSTTTAGASQSLKVSARDLFGNPVTTYTGTVAFTSTDPKAVLPSSYTFTGADAGAHTFSAALKTAGSQSITATDTVTNTITGTESGITVNPAATSALQISAPASVKATTAFTIVLRAVDSFGNTTTSYAGTVHFTSFDGSATLPTNFVFSAADSGVHTFANGVTLVSAGSQTVTATDTVTSSITGHATIQVNSSLAGLFGRVSTSGQWWVAASNGSSGFANRLVATWNPNVTWVDIQTGDFNGDGKTDIIGRVLQTGQWWVAINNGSTFTTTLWATWNPAVTWVDVKVGDFTGNGKADIVGRWLQAGVWYVGVSTGSSFTTTQWATWNPNVTWVDVNIGDFNGDGKADLTGRALQAGSWWTAISTGSSFITSQWANWNPAATWVDTQVGDFNGDGKADIASRYSQTGQWWIALSTGSAFSTTLWTTWNPTVTWVDVKVGDFNGDGKTDIIGRVLQTGQWWASISSGSGFSTSLWATWSPTVTWVDVQVGDFNGDGRDDITGRVLQTGQIWTGLSNGSTAFNSSLWTTWASTVNWVDVHEAEQTT
jgi:hypothetical protein